MSKISKDFKEQLERQRKEFEKYDNSEQRIYDDISILDTIIKDDEIGKELIVKTLFKLPKKVREKVLDNVIFIYTYCAGISTKLFFRKPILKKGNIKYIEFEQPIIILNFQQMKKGNEINTIAHEIAHFILGHYKMENISNPRNERDADNLITKWGFKKCYSEIQYKHVERKRN